MIEILWNKDLFPEEYKNLDIEDVQIVFRSYYGIYIDKGTIVCGVFTNEVIGPKQLFCIHSPEAGFITIGKPAKSYGGRDYFSSNSVLFTIRSFQEKLDSIEIDYQINTDSFTNEKRINWKPYFKFNYLDTLYFDFIEGTPCLSIKVSNNHFNPKLKDSFSLLFANKAVKQFLIKKRPVKDKEKYSTVAFEITESDLNEMINVPLVSYRFDSKTTEPYTFNISFFNSVGLGQSVFRIAASKFAEALDEIGYTWTANESKDGSATTDEPCYVYLMVDTANGYHKIGISNHPEYREGTLQSEKPTIELLCAKQFPSRVIAKAIESALHKTYENKHLRGEWFQLDAKDIIDLMATLK